MEQRQAGEHDVVDVDPPLANVVPLARGLSGVDGATIGAFVGFGVAEPWPWPPCSPTERAQYWLPIVPGVFAYLRLFRTVRG